MEDSRNLLEMTNIVKTFPGVKALKGVNLNVRPGEIHALLGENGAGKSTLMNCLIGKYPPTAGEILFDGERIEDLNTAMTLQKGISMIHQELSPVEHRSIMENIWLGREPKNKLGLIDHDEMYRKTEEVLKQIDLREDPRTLMSELTVAKMQMVEIAKAISYNAKLILMDEPTSALTDGEVEQLFNIINRLKEKGTAIVYISHKLEEIFEICDRITVLRDGTYVDTVETKNIDTLGLVKMMVGRDIEDLFPEHKSNLGKVRLEVRNLSDGDHFENVSFDLREGEILGVAGLVGAGRTEIFETIFGLRNKEAGEIILNGEEVEIKNPSEAKKHKIGFLTEDRRTDGIFPMLSVSENITVANIKSYIKNGLFDHKLADKDVDKYIKELNIRTPSPEQQIQHLSGGNQQKALIAKWLLTDPDILIIDEPTKGIDIGAKTEIYKLLHAMTEEGRSIVMISSELPEVMGMSDRILVINEGEVTGILENTEDITQEEIMLYATGQK